MKPFHRPLLWSLQVQLWSLWSLRSLLLQVWFSQLSPLGWDLQVSSHTLLCIYVVSSLSLYLWLSISELFPFFTLYFHTTTRTTRKLQQQQLHHQHEQQHEHEQYTAQQLQQHLWILRSIHGRQTNPIAPENQLQLHSLTSAHPVSAPLTRLFRFRLAAKIRGQSGFDNSGRGYYFAGDGEDDADTGRNRGHGGGYAYSRPSPALNSPCGSRLLGGNCPYSGGGSKVTSSAIGSDSSRVGGHTSVMGQEGGPGSWTYLGDQDKASGGGSSSSSNGSSASSSGGSSSGGSRERERDRERDAQR